jgi:hypothetical protein
MPSSFLPHRVCVFAVVLATALQGGSAASLRAAPAKTAESGAEKPSPKTAPKAPVAQDVADKVAQTIAKAMAASTERSAPTEKSVQAPSSTQPVQHKKLDVGFSDFEKNLTEEVSQKLLRTATGTAWNDDMRSKFQKNVTDAMKDTLKVILQPVKQSIGKTWMALPKDEQKDEYVETLKKSFAPVFEKSMETVSSHLDLSLKRVKEYSNEKSPLSSVELLEKAEFSVEDSLITEHCYEVGAKKAAKSSKKVSNSTETKAEKKKFCIQSVIGALAHRLNDTQGLISMSMRFEAGAMSLAQKKNKGIKH